MVHLTKSGAQRTLSSSSCDVMVYQYIKVQCTNVKFLILSPTTPYLLQPHSPTATPPHLPLTHYLSIVRSSAPTSVSTTSLESCHTCSLLYSETAVSNKKGKRSSISMLSIVPSTFPHVSILIFPPSISPCFFLFLVSYSPS